MLNRFLKRVAPLGVLALGAALSGCAYGVSWDVDGVPLADLDTGGDPPTQIALAGPDRVVISEGPSFTIDAEGADDAVSALRFDLGSDSLTIARDPNIFDGPSKATVTITIPELREIDLAGSGTITADTMADNGEINVAGSGRIEVTQLSASSLEVNMAGSGRVSAAGSAERLEVNVMGSGDVDLAALMAEAAEVSIAGSGDVAFASDGEVEANIAGSGDVTVTGRARCNVNAMGSGTLTCKPASAAAAAGELADETAAP